ncbi:MAG: hypothetical protein R6V76_08840 [Desulfobacterales bacterium]
MVCYFSGKETLKMMLAIESGRAERGILICGSGVGTLGFSFTDPATPAGAQLIDIPMEEGNGI